MDGKITRNKAIKQLEAAKDYLGGFDIRNRPDLQQHMIKSIVDALIVLLDDTDDTNDIEEIPCMEGTLDALNNLGV